MALKIVRNDITRMQVDAIVNTANEYPEVGPGCDYAVYQAAGYEALLALRAEIGQVPEGEAFLTPGLKLSAKYIIHAVSPMFIDGSSDEETRLRACYRNSLAIARREGFHSVAFPLIATGGYGYPKEEGLRIAVDEMHAFLMTCDMLIYLVVFDQKATQLGSRLYPDLERYIDQKYVDEMHAWENEPYACEAPGLATNAVREKTDRWTASSRKQRGNALSHVLHNEMPVRAKVPEEACLESSVCEAPEDFELRLEHELAERISHAADTFSEYLIYLIDSKHMSYPEVYKRAIVDKKVFSKIKNNPDSHPKKMTAMCLCIGAMLNLDEARDLLARAGYALSPCDKTDIIFSYFIEHQIYDMIELDIQLEEHGLPCLIA